MTMDLSNNMGVDTRRIPVRNQLRARNISIALDSKILTKGSRNKKSLTNGPTTKRGGEGDKGRTTKEKDLFWSFKLKKIPMTTKHHKALMFGPVVEELFSLLP